MYITITPQKLGANYSQSSGDFVRYLEKENEGRSDNELEHFFNQYEDHIKTERVVSEIDSNTSKLKKIEPKFYSITVNPSKRELEHLESTSQDLKRYTRELMKDYVKAFNREINGKPVSVDDIKYFAKIEHSRSFKGTDREVIENQPIASRIMVLQNEKNAIKHGYKQGDIEQINKRIAKLEQDAPHQQNGKRIVQGMQKGGEQSHIHIIVSRKDQSNSVSLSPGSKYRSSEVEMNGKKVQRGFDRDKFFSAAEKTFDKTFSYERNYVELYTSRRDFVKDPKRYYSNLMVLPNPQRVAAFKMMRETGLPLPPHIPTNQIQLAYKVFNALKRGVGLAVKSSSISY